MNLKRIENLNSFEYVEQNHESRIRFLLVRDFSIRLVGAELGNHSFCDEWDREFVSIDGDTFTVRKGYSWDGCSPKVVVNHARYGTPDFEYTRAASLIHDACWQFMSAKCFPISRNQSNRIFRKLILLNGGSLFMANLYFFAVSTFGWPYAAISLPFKSTKIRCNQHS